MVKKAAAYIKDRIIIWMVTAVLGGLVLNLLWLNVTVLGVEGSRNTKVEGAVRDGRLKELEAKHKNGIEADIKEIRKDLQRIHMQLVGITTQLTLQKRE